MKKDEIDKLISSLEDFTKNPPDDLWNGIEERLNTPKKKKVLAYWWPVAASLLIGLGLFSIFYFQSKESVILENNRVNPENGVVDKTRSIDVMEKKNQEDIFEEKDKNNDSDATVFKGNSNRYPNYTGITSNGKPSKPLGTKKSDVKNQMPNYQDKALVLNDKVVNQNPLADKNNGVLDKKEVTQKQNEDSNVSRKEELKDNALAELLKEKESKLKSENVKERWSLQLFAGVNSSQNINNQKSLGNPIASQKGYNYGMKTNYKLNRRWAVSTGLKVSELGQQVANVSYMIASKSLINVVKTNAAISNQEGGGITSNSNYLFFPKTSVNSSDAMAYTFYETANLTQKVQYAELPMEVSYAVLNKGKTRVNLNTGGFVGKVISNKVMLDNSVIGKNSNVNDVVFGTVLSSTLQYELYKKTSFFVEPGMNYYSQPVQNQKFNQFQLVLNFGLNLSF
ncbi:outer membrane beta-barrel protein [Flavobacterium flavipallidum]|uniref:Outer membrane protein beta-barrel domain-containing protein n=1 Tax=Flavobacterium flavipallidum TaxID=3139140 RepID=A0ABU9HNI4_9FLAO